MVVILLVIETEIEAGVGKLPPLEHPATPAIPVKRTTSNLFPSSADRLTVSVVIFDLQNPAVQRFFSCFRLKPSQRSGLVDKNGGLVLWLGRDLVPDTGLFGEL
jgi:hypothetical protein